MFDLNEKLAIYKFDLIKKCLNANGKDKSYWKELKEKLITLDSLIKRAKTDCTLECAEEIKNIKEYIAKTR